MGAYNRSSSQAHWQAKFDLPQQPSAPKWPRVEGAKVDEGAKVHDGNPNPRLRRGGRLCL